MLKRKWEIFFMVVCFVLFSMMGYAGDTKTFEWEPNIESDVAGYRLYQSKISGSYLFGEGNSVSSTLAGAETITLTNISDGEYFWVVTCFDNHGNESGPSNEVTSIIDTTSPSEPIGLSITN